MVLFCQPPDPDQGVAAAASTGCERRIAHLLRLAHHGQQRVCIGLLIAGEQRLGVLPATRRGDVLEGDAFALSPTSSDTGATAHLRASAPWPSSPRRGATCRRGGDPSAGRAFARQRRSIPESPPIACGTVSIPPPARPA